MKLNLEVSHSDNLGGKFSDEREIERTKDVLSLSSDRTALILIDVWNSHGLTTWMNRIEPNIQNKIIPLLDLCRRANITVIFVSHRELYEAIDIKEDEHLIDHEWDQIKPILEKNKIRNLLYSGYASNRCLLFSDVGLYEIGKKTPINVILLRDCTKAIEISETIEKEWMNRAAIFAVECEPWGQSSTLPLLRRAIEGARK